MKAKTATIAIVAPRNMYFAPARATSIDLHIYETSRWSRYADRLCVFAEHVDAPFAGVETKFWERDAPTARICDLVARSRPAAVIAHQHLPTAAALARALSGIPVALVRHNFQKPPRNWVSARMKLAQFNRLATIGFVSECSLADFRQNWPAVIAPTRTVLNGVDSQDWTTGEPKEKLILFTGRMAPEKGALEAAEAMRKVLDGRPDWRGMMIVASAEQHRAYADAVRATVAAAGDRIELLTDVSHEHVRRAAMRAAIALAPTQNREPFGRVAIEAMASGAALVATARGGFVEIVGDAGVLLEEPTAANLAEAILALIDDPARRERLAVAARKRVAERYHFTEAVKSFDAMVADLLGEA